MELFSGTGSVGKVAEEMGHLVVSLDRDMEATIKTDIMKWDIKQLNQVHLILFGPPHPAQNTAKQKQQG